MYATIFGQFMTAFHFLLLHRRNKSVNVGPVHKVQYLTLEKFLFVDYPKEDHKEREFKP